MHANSKRAFSALAMVSLLAVVVLGIIALTSVPVSAPYVTTESKRVELTPNSGTSGNVGDTMSFTVKVINVEQTRWEGPTPPGFIPQGSGSEGPAGSVSGTVSFSGLGGSGESASYVTDSSGSATVTHAFSQAGTYTIYAHAGGYSSNGVAITIAAGPTEPTPTPDGGGGGDASGGDSGAGSGNGSTPTPSTSVAAIGDIAAQVETVTGLGSNWLLIVLAVIIIVILAIIATALLMRRRG